MAIALLNRRLAGILVLLACEGALLAQVGQYPPGGYPPGGYPPGQIPGRYPPGVGLPIPRRTKRPPDAQNKQPSAYLSGVVQEVGQKSLQIETSDKRKITLQVSERTRFLSENQQIKLSDLKPGDHVEVQAQQDENGLFQAMEVRLQATGQQDAGDASAPREAGSTEAGRRTAPVAEAAPDPDDPGPPALKRGAPPKAKEPAATRKKQPQPRPASSAASSAQRAEAPPSSDAENPPAARQAGVPVANADENSVAGNGRARMPVPTASADPRVALLDKAREAADSFAEKLPNYVCQQFTTRYVSRTSRPNWEAQDVVSAAVVYEEGKESYRNIAVNGRPTNKAMEQLGGAWSTGEFATILLDIFSPATAAKFRYRKDSVASGLAAAVYDFEVAQPNSHWNVMAPGQSVNPAYRGSVWIDKETARALRIEMQAVRLPEAFPLDTVESAVDYAFVRIGAQQYLLPAASENLSCQRGASICSRNVIDFRNYHKYVGESSISFPQ